MGVKEDCYVLVFMSFSSDIKSLLLEKLGR